MSQEIFIEDRWNFAFNCSFNWNLVIFVYESLAQACLLQTASGLPVCATFFGLKVKLVIKI